MSKNLIAFMFVTLTTSSLCLAENISSTADNDISVTNGMIPDIQNLALESDTHDIKNTISITLTSEQKLKYLVDQNHLLKREIESLKKEISYKNGAFTKELEIATKNSSSLNITWWVSILLACVGIGITVLGIMLAVLTFIGYKNLERRVISESSRKAAEKADETVKLMVDESVEKTILKMISEEKFDKYFKNLIEQLSYSGISLGNPFDNLDDEEGEQQ